ncbi:hypothetical protein RR48_02951 [Papilio machaon]|uniref:Secreted protein n=1 Tax=Papilio machaon TaxID=76193 RepID=A0A0N1I613_PAPMA|nr:hypothetical protein RR48_02951 [Papilio machaon]
MLHVLVVLVTLLAFAVRWHYLMADMKARSVDAVESSRWCGGRRQQPGAGEIRQQRARPAASLHARSAALRPPCKRDPDIFLDNEPIGQQPRVHTYAAHT